MKLKNKISQDKIYSTEEQLSVKTQLGDLFESDRGQTSDKLSAFTKYITRQDLSLFLARYEIFKKVMGIKGSIIECGVYFGNGLMTYSQLSAALEPINYNRRIIGFDTFCGNKGETKNDLPSKAAAGLTQAQYDIDSENEILKCINIYDKNRFLNHISKVELVRGDIIKTIPQYIIENPHLIVSILELSVNLYEPTKVALKHILPRMTKGSIISVNTLNEGIFPGVTLAIKEELGINNVCIQSFEYAPNLSYIVL